jgi:glutathione synthase
MKLGVVLDPLAQINYKKDSTLAMMASAQKLGWQIFTLQLGDLYILDGTVKGKFTQLAIREGRPDWYEVLDQIDIPLTDMTAVLMRKEPPFDMEFIYATYLLEMAEQQGLAVLNRPGSIRDCNEKLFALQFPQCCPPHLVSRDLETLKQFHQTNADVIFKPLDGMGGSSIFRVKSDDPNLSVILETLTDHGQRQIMAQRFIPEIAQGDTRILLINGEPVPFGLARIPAKGETRGNLAAGGSGVARPLTDSDYRICEAVGPALKERGLYFVGIDVIGEYLTEINVTCPTCIREIDAAFNLDIATDYMNFVETLVN